MGAPFRTLPDLERDSVEHVIVTSQGIVKLKKSSVAQPQEIAIGRRCEHEKFCRSSEIVRQLDHASSQHPH